MTSFFGNPSLFVGLEKTSSYLRLATLIKKGKGWEVAHLKEIPCEENVNPLDKLSRDAIVTTTLSNREVLVRSLEIPLKKEKDIVAALPFQMEPHLPYPLEKCLLQKTTLQTSSNGSLLTVYSAKKEAVRQHLDLWKTFLIDPDHVTSAPHALACFTKVLSISQEPIFIIYLSEKEGLCALVENHKVLSARATDKDLSQIEKTILAMSSSFKNKKIDSILFLGEESNWKERLEETLQKKVLLPSLPTIAPENLSKFAIAIGMALSGGECEKCDFRQGDFSYPRPWKKLQRPLFLFCTSLCLLLGSLYGLTTLLLHKEEKRVQKEFASLLAQEEKKEETFTFEKLETRLQELEKEIKSRPDTYPLLPLVPQVNDLLAWLSHHPQFSEDSTEVESLHYTLEKRPDFTRKNERYLVKVHLEFSTPNPLDARSFYESLSSSNPFVDTKKEIQWNPGKGKYSVSFYLKDKTRYP